jgi:hypothetical protein
MFFFKIKLIEKKHRSNISLSSTDSDNSSIKSYTNLAEFSSSSTSSTFDSYNSIIETNSTNLIFEEKFKTSNVESTAMSTETTSKLNTTEPSETSTGNAQTKTVHKNTNTNSDSISLRSSRFKKKFEKLKRLNKLIYQNNEMIESKMDVIDYNKSSSRPHLEKEATFNFDEKNKNKQMDVESLKRFFKKQKEKKLNHDRIRNSCKLKQFPNTPVQSINLSQLQHLSLRNLGTNVIKPSMLNSLLKNFQCLKYLDISNCCTNQLHYLANNNTKNINGKILEIHL